MPLIIPKDIPAFKILKDNIFVMDTQRAFTQDIRALEILIVNLMPTKIQTENQLLSLLANSPLQINITFVSTHTYIGKNTSYSHLEKFYKNINECEKLKFDGAIITGAPVEKIDFGAVKYWEELTRIFDFLKNNVTSSMYICWGAMAALWYFYGVEKIALKEKIFGIFSHQKIQDDLLLTNLDINVLMPHSRHSGINEEQILALKQQNQIKILLKSTEAGSGIIRNKKDVFILGHLEYFQDSLHQEYVRDNCIQKAKNYYDVNGTMHYNWRSNANTIFLNWLNYDVYQSTPFVL
ncbi:homoserine O-succinyltransferase [Campylobacter lari]|nr:homoserine O-succinyltransferase [Campylobacter lari]MCV3421568.1 homoserine O-succinyltransferase [Campylobacter lari]